MVSPNGEIWQWQSGFNPRIEFEMLEKASSMVFRAEDIIKKYDVVALYGSGSTWKYPDGTLPSVVSCSSNVTDCFKTIGVAMNDCDSGSNVTVKMEGLVVCKTNAAIAAADWVRGSVWGASEKMGCIYKSANTGEILLGIALNESVAPTTLGTGTTATPYNYRPVVVKLFVQGDPLNR